MADLPISHSDYRDNQYRAYVVMLGDIVKYVGVTKGTIKFRWQCHVSDSRHGKRVRALGNAIIKYGEDAFSIYHVASAFDDESLDDLERILIVQYDTLKNGYNLTGGGKRRYCFSPEALERIRLVKIGMVVSETTKAKHRAYVHQPGSRAKMSAVRTGKKRSAESIAKTVAVHLGSRRSPETCLKIADSKKNLSPQSRERIAAAQRGKKRSPEAIEKVASQLRGRKLSPRSAAHCAAISRSKRLRNGYPLEAPISPVTPSALNF